MNFAEVVRGLERRLNVQLGPASCASARLHLRRKWWYDVRNVRWSKRLARAAGSSVGEIVSWGVVVVAASAIALIIVVILGGMLGAS